MLATNLIRMMVRRNLIAMRVRPGQRRGLEKKLTVRERRMKTKSWRKVPMITGFNG